MKSNFLTFFILLLLVSDEYIVPLSAFVVQGHLGNSLHAEDSNVNKLSLTGASTYLKPKRGRFPFFTSFLQSKIETESSSLSSALMWTKLLSLKKRKTKDGRKCANAFVQDGQTFTDCTATKSPDGKMTYKEWCYVDPTSGGSPNWGFCHPILNYDKVREKRRNILNELVPAIRKVSSMTLEEIPSNSQTINNLEIQKKHQAECDTRVQALKEEVDLVDRNYETILDLKSKWEELEVLMADLRREIADLKKINPDDSPKNCEGLLGYEEETDGDGIVGKYYDNENFIGTAVHHNEKEINFDWNGDNPLPSINHENFSAEWKTYLRVPVTAMYIFRAEADDGFSVSINGQKIISRSLDDGKTFKSWLDTRASEGETSYSREVFLFGGAKYLMTVKYFHTIHNSFNEQGMSFLRVSWKSNESTESVIEPEYFYLTNKLSPLKITGYDSKSFILQTLRETDDAFKDSRNFKLADIPMQFSGLNQLRLNTHISNEELTFLTNSPLILYVAINDHQPNPLPHGFQDTEEFMSVLRIAIENSSRSKEIHAKQSFPFRIYRKKFPPGKVSIPLTYTKKVTQTSLVMFYTLNVQEIRPLSCGGIESNIALSTSESFESCAASSSYPNGMWNCEFAFSGKMADAPFSGWASNGEGIGAWIQVKFKKEYQVTSIEIKNRNNPSERNREMEIIFSNGYSITVGLKNTDKSTMISIVPVITSSVKFVVKSVYGTLNNGAAINVYGVPCQDDSETKGSNDDYESPINLKCQSNLINNDEIIKKNFQVGNSFVVQCNSACLNEDVSVYGSISYSEDSAICKSALHAGVLQMAGGSFRVMIGKGKDEYKPEFRNGFTSSTKLRSDKSISFEPIEDRALSEINRAFVGMKVDIFDQIQQKWLPGNIEKLDRKSKMVCRISVSKVGYGPEFAQVVTWPDKKIVDYCGEHINDRDCDDASKNIFKIKPLEYKFCYTFASTCPNGYILDSGEIYSLKGKLEYGWSRDVRDNARTRRINADPLLDNLILFNPDPKSQWCMTDKPRFSCEPISWSFKIRNGKYSIKITAGDPGQKAAYWINVNGKPFIDGRILEKNQFYSPNLDIQVADGLIKLTNDCPKNCENVWSRITSIEIIQIPDDTKIAKISSAVPLGCGFAFKGGRCEDGSNPVDCVYDSPTDQGMEKCSGTLQFIRISNKYECKDQRNKLKCVKSKYETIEECRKSCPGNCRGISCYSQ